MRWLLPLLSLLLTACSTTPSNEGFMHSPLNGAHATLSCSDCHASELHETIPTTCIGCHVGDAPAEHYPEDCGECHGEETWGIDGIDHSFFPLVGGHEEPGCIDCHGTDDYDAASEVCLSCHARPDEHYDGACDDCHTVYTWDDAEIDHSFFPLTLGHDGPSCTDCHGSDDYEDASATCSTCHSRPTGHFIGACDDCHNRSDWDDAELDHSFFPLTQGHNGPTCTDCHGNDDYEDASDTCSSCHDSPNNHFPGACDDCHNRSDWDDADFEHDPFFPTPHEGVSNCTSCHPGNDYTDFTCTDCHEHRRSEMDDEHEDETDDYVYASWACLDCHPDGDD